MSGSWRYGVGRRGVLLSVLLGAVLQPGCASWPSPAERSAEAGRLAAAAGLAPVAPTEAPLPLRGFARLGCPGAPVHVYIEGDGLAWLSVSTPSPDPTPLSPVALVLAAADAACNVLYLGRPGQYAGGGVDPRYWQGARFSQEVVDSYLAALAQLAPPPSALRLAGYSGGGALAVLVAARLHGAGRQVSLVTVAGNLDIEAWTRRRKLTPLAQSLNPADAAAALAGVPQVHFSGRRDRQVPDWVLESYLARLPSRACVRVERRDAAHGGPWDDVPQVLARQPPACTALPAGGS